MKQPTPFLLRDLLHMVSAITSTHPWLAKFRRDRAGNANVASHAGARFVQYLRAKNLDQFIADLYKFRQASGTQRDGLRLSNKELMTLLPKAHLKQLRAPKEEIELAAVNEQLQLPWTGPIESTRGDTQPMLLDRDDEDIEVQMAAVQAETDAAIAALEQEWDNNEEEPAQKNSDEKMPVPGSLEEKSAENMPVPESDEEKSAENMPVPESDEEMLVDAVDDNDAAMLEVIRQKNKKIDELQRQLHRMSQIVQTQEKMIEQMQQRGAALTELMSLYDEQQRLCGKAVALAEAETQEERLKMIEKYEAMQASGRRQIEMMDRLVHDAETFGLPIVARDAV